MVEITSNLVSPVRPSDDDLLPFTCESCNLSYEDAPALIIISKPEGMLRYCTDSCAEEAGWTEAVVLRWDAEISGEALRIIYTP